MVTNEIASQKGPCFSSSNQERWHADLAGLSHHGTLGSCYKNLWNSASGTVTWSFAEWSEA
jgi:hypothetical protein